MGMSRAEKDQEIEALNARFDESEVVVLTHYSGLTVKQMSDLRGKLRENGASFKVTKNTLAKRALKGTRYEQLDDMFTGPTGVATSQDPVAAAKVAYEFAKENDKLIILGGAMGDVKLSADAVKQLASMPSLDELRAQIVTLIMSPARNLAGAIQSPGGKVAGAIKAIADKTE